MIVKSYAAEEHAEQEAANRMRTHLRDRMRKNNLANLGTSGVAVAINAMYVYGIIYCARGIMTGSVSYPLPASADTCRDGLPCWPAPNA